MRLPAPAAIPSSASRWSKSRRMTFRAHHRQAAQESQCRAAERIPWSSRGLAIHTAPPLMIKCALQRALANSPDAPIGARWYRWAAWKSFSDARFSTRGREYRGLDRAEHNSNDERAYDNRHGIG